MGLRERFRGQIYGITCYQRSMGRSTEEVVRLMLEAGISIIQYREKQRPMETRYDECVLLRKMTAAANALFIVNDDVGLALLTGADGIHIGQDDMPPGEARAAVGRDLFVGVSTHSPEQAKKAVAEGADYIGAGPVYSTDTKEGVCPPVGLEYIRHCAENIGIPFVAIGGIKEHNLKDVLNAGAECVSLVTEITESPDITGRVAALKKIMKERGKGNETNL